MFLSGSWMPYSTPQPFNAPIVSSAMPKREMRAVWIATVDNIDWPSRKGLPTDVQQQEFVNIIDKHAETGINAVFVQVRNACDAYYAKSLEPWSEWLTGEQGKAPSPYYDPLEFMIDESHKRGLEFHAWLNLNRAVFKRATSLTSDHISKTHPEWMLAYDGQKLLNFGIPEVRQYITDVVLNLTRNYDIDGIHFDDYFYPYPASGQEIPDHDTFRQHPNGFRNIEDWRRNNTDLLIKQISEAVRAEKPYVKFGISPFGVWRNKREDLNGSETYGYNSSYDNLFADTRKWVKMGWIDYIAPQVYFNASHKLIPYQNLVRWWASNSFGRHLYIGQAAYRVAGDTKSGGWNNSEELTNQIRFNRNFEQIQGSIFFSSKSITNNAKGIKDSLQYRFYRFPALIPTMPWKDNTPPIPPTNLSVTRNAEDNVFLEWAPPPRASDGERANYYVIYRFEKDHPIILNDPSHIVGISRIPEFVDTSAQNDHRYIYIITSVDRLHNESVGSRELRVKT
jgi:uncharacterized lipoprotein YddW (UPF0748 family)